MSCGVVVGVAVGNTVGDGHGVSIYGNDVDVGVWGEVVAITGGSGGGVISVLGSVVGVSMTLRVGKAVTISAAGSVTAVQPANNMTSNRDNRMWVDMPTFVTLRNGQVRPLLFRKKGAVYPTAVARKEIFGVRRQ